MLKLVTSDGAHLRGLVSGQHSFKETSQRWQAIGDDVQFDQQGIRTPVTRPTAPIADWLLVNSPSVSSCMLK